MSELSIELRLLAYAALICILLWLPYVLARAQTWGLAATAGYPEDPPALPGWALRSIRAHANWVENLAPFAALVLLAHVGNASNEMTALGARLFFWGQLVRTVVHIAGVPWIRTGAFMVSWLGMVLIFLQVIGY
ncbi:MAG TPA: MAPEG family protein [Alphaproteobacteria bacterium]|jgi:uncharacterized MAPEG superfamily protein|nr:MAPEG family protein [Alphaproteobacteria bacterium]MDP6270388.1 MAPEG family protein [Alphaproteobacteria bacterium]MDP7163734.1 MAPEG family protein [Alphaproteobacteria bacterium]MDP7427156.1 MAPEG family protein [Alphaproteobacteria bacterium]HJM50197.1 MAPEG family protein [Alphaproteobacteria bacterium]|tara:strand:- start:131 stop:532 length:402 start_codon:yes stop_codon:yes gene_type:complete